MIDYTSQHTCPRIDQGVQIALEWDPKLIGCTRVTSTMSAPLNLDIFLNPGSWIVDYYTNGPINLLNYTPLPFSVSETYDGPNLVKVTQSVDIETVKAYRTYTVSTKTWTTWVEQGFPKIVSSSGTQDNIVVNDTTIGVSDLKEITIQLANTLNENATVTINGNGPYSLKMPDGRGVPGNVFRAGSFIKVIFSKLSNSFYLIATPIPDDLAQTLEQYGARIQGLETKTDNISSTLTDIGKQVEKNTEDIIALTEGGGFAHSVDHSSDNQANVPWTKITFNEEGVILRGEYATGEDIKVSTDDETTVAERIDEILKIIPNVENMESGKVVITDENGKIATSTMTKDQLLRVIIFEEGGETADNLPS